MSNLILTICSNRKCEERGESVYDRNARTVASVLSDDMQRELNKARNRAFNHITDQTRTGRFPAGRPLNEELKRGPDMDPDHRESSGYYMPALKQYDGRFYKNFKSAVGNVDRGIERMNGDSENHLLIVSGLYGLLTPTEPIQKYSCDVTDEPKIKRLWKKGDLLTELVLSYMRKCRINRVFDFMADDSYRHLINWELIEKTCDKIFYSRYENQTGPDMLPELGKAAGFLLSGRVAQKLSEIEHLDKINSTHIKLSLKAPPRWVPADSTFSDREKCMVWVTRMETNLRHFLDCYFIEGTPPKKEKTSEKICRFLSEGVSYATIPNKHELSDIMGKIMKFRNDVVHNYCNVDARKMGGIKIDRTASKSSERIPNNKKIRDTRNYYRVIIESAEVYADEMNEDFFEPEDVDY